MREFKLGPATRDAYGETLLELGKENPDIVVLDADLSESTRTKKFGETFPERFFNVGIAEANMVSVAAGLARTGKIPFISSFACFLLCKGYDQLRVGVAFPQSNVKIVASHGGISIGEDGPSQQSVEDIALACALPGMWAVVPADQEATSALVRKAVEHVGPVYVRVGRPKVPIVYPDGSSFELGKAFVHRLGKDATIVANGLLLVEAFKAEDILRQKGLDVGVIDMHTVKPVDEEAVAEAARASGALVTAEEHLLTGGLANQVVQAAARTHPVPIECVGIKDTYAESGTPEQLMEKYGLTASRVVRAVETVVQRKKNPSPVLAD